MFDEAPVSHYSLMQDPAFAAALRLCGQDPVTLPGGLLVLRRRVAGLQICMLPRAVPPIDLENQLRTVGLHRTPIILSPEAGCSLPPSLPLQSPRRMAVWDITKDTASLRHKLHPKWRNQLRRAEKAQIEFQHVPLSPDPLGHVLNTAEEQARARNYCIWPSQLTAAFASVAHQQTHLFCALASGREVAHMLFLSHGDCATYHLGFIKSEGKSVSAHNAILWRAAVELSARGVRTINLGVLDHHPAALNRFKLRTGARIVSTGGTHLYWRPFARR